MSATLAAGDVRRATRSQWMELQRVGHFVPLEAPAALNAALDGALICPRPIQAIACSPRTTAGRVAMRSTHARTDG